MIQHIWELILKVADENQLDPYLLGAIVEQESACNPYAIRFEPAWKIYKTPEVYAKKLGISFETEKNQQACSHGLCQIMGTVARENAFDGQWAMLYDEELNLTIASLHLKKFLRKYGGEEQSAIVSYNAGSPRRGIDGKYVNESYLTSVRAHKEKLKNFLKGSSDE